MAGVKGTRVEQGPAPNSKRTGASSSGPGRPAQAMPREGLQGITPKQHENAATHNKMDMEPATRSTSMYKGSGDSMPKANTPGRPYNKGGK